MHIGKLTASARFGSLPKVLCEFIKPYTLVCLCAHCLVTECVCVCVVAGMCGYFAGKLSYMKACQQKFYKLENSPIAETLRQRHRHHQRPPQ